MPIPYTPERGRELYLKYYNPEQRKSYYAKATEKYGKDALNKQKMLQRCRKDNRLPKDKYILKYNITEEELKGIKIN